MPRQESSADARIVGGVDSTSYCRVLTSPEGSGQHGYADIHSMSPQLVMWAPWIFGYDWLIGGGSAILAPRGAISFCRRAFDEALETKVRAYDM
jgi:hypothetical protein